MIIVRSTFILLSSPALHAAVPVAKWFAYAACVASSADFATTAYKVQSGGYVRELNPLLAGQNGRPVLWRMGVLKGGICAGQVYMANRKMLIQNKTGTFSVTVSDFSVLTSAPSVAAFTWATVHNIRELRKSPGAK